MEQSINGFINNRCIGIFYFIDEPHNEFIILKHKKIDAVEEETKEIIRISDKEYTPYSELLKFGDSIYGHGLILK